MGLLSGKQGTAPLPLFSLWWGRPFPLKPRLPVCTMELHKADFPHSLERGGESLKEVGIVVESAALLGSPACNLTFGLVGGCR